MKTTNSIQYEHSSLRLSERKLGVQYTNEASVFSVWSPPAVGMEVLLFEQGQEHPSVYRMIKDKDDVWSTTIEGNQAGKGYLLRVHHAGGIIHDVVDPYATAVEVNGTRGAIIDLSATHPEDWHNDQRPALEHPLDAVIYELHVRDFSIDPDSGIVNRGGYKAFTESGCRDRQGNPVGIDHLQELGVTHVHLMPIYDFSTVDESGDQRTFGSLKAYNWGYDPLNYNAPEGSYASDPTHPAVRITELKEMVASLHRQGMRVIMDVVYNHVVDAGSSAFEKLVPGYYFRLDEQGNYSNGSGTGNEMATEKPMVRKFIIDSVMHWAKEYHLDGFRFDLMGLVDTTTIRLLTEQLRQEIDPHILVYGEPWTAMDTPLTEQTLKGSQKGMGFAVFNDTLRDAIKGDTDGTGKGYATGERGVEGEIAEGMMGSIHSFTDGPEETINYTTVHDNLNLWDKVTRTMGIWDALGFPEFDHSQPLKEDWVEKAVKAADPYRLMDSWQLLDNEAVRRCLLANGIVLLSQGIPLIQAGDELLRSKFGDHNSYHSGDWVNAIRWENKARFRQVFDYYRGLISLRRSHPAFRLRSREDIERHMTLLQGSQEVVAFLLKEHAGGDDWAQIAIISNGSPSEQEVTLPQPHGEWRVVVKDGVAGTAILEQLTGHQISVPHLSMMVLYDSGLTCG
ncbi:type I pullulanase [Paenibacillus sp. JX-17]|uniref:Type I pullulanase n=1 Tax=Paenibacillus lacisoli TaxID=3064525 RepID=A0ABT9CKG5_9BACL|nr:type I pullulanase [Paenibacillus sp. JX-17]MDO7908156.1 type I pullulanase [Paenibacillus sp. JX-17]